MVALNHAIAVAMVRGPARGLALLDALDDDARIGDHHRLDAVRAHLLERAGDRDGDRSVPPRREPHDEHARAQLLAAPRSAPRRSGCLDVVGRSISARPSMR